MKNKEIYRNEIKSYIIRAGMTMSEAVELADEYGWSSSVPNLSDKLKRGSLRYGEAVELAGHAERIDHRSHAARGLEERPTVHEGVAAQALERRGILSDRCELNRQIKADNALLRELKAELKKLSDLVVHTVSAVAERLEKLRGRVLIFCYQLSHIRAGRERYQDALHVYRPQMARYNGLVRQIKDKSRERKAPAG